MINQKEYRQRREQFLKTLPENSIALLFSAPVYERNHDNEYRFRQNSDFYYLTGLNESHAVAVFRPNRADGAYHLYVTPNDPEKTVWTGKRAGLEGACEIYGADQAFAYDDFYKSLPDLLTQSNCLLYPIGQYPEVDKAIHTCLESQHHRVRRGIPVPERIQNVRQIIHAMRLIKSKAEIEVMQKVATVSANAHIQAMQAAMPNLFEYELEAVLLHEFVRHGCRNVAYDPIVAAGANACVLHYTKNDDKIKPNDLILIDAGAEYDCYASDITRTFPANGKYSAEQAQIYDIVLQAQQDALALAKPGTVWHDIQIQVIQTLTEGLCDLGILQGNVEDLIAEKHYAKFYMHNFGHWIGLDTHDVGLYKIDGDWRPLQENMVLTIEPGIYIAPGTENVPEKYWGIGIRIEDDVAITANGCEILTSAAPKKRDDIEALMQ